MSVQRFFMTSAACGAMVLFAGGNAASAQTTCEMTCLGELVATCVAESNSVANWWEFGKGFQTCVASESGKQCGAWFLQVAPPLAGTIAISFSPLEDDTKNCQILASTDIDTGS